ncbi:MAG: phosphotransferase [Spirochaetes bacterium]|nr:phosphotransferase [Spirochaetota bacterium]
MSNDKGEVKGLIAAEDGPETAMKNEHDTAERIVSRLTPWLREKITGASEITISGIQKPGMGLSNETYLFDLAWDEGGARHEKGMVLRCPPADHRVFPDYHLSHQYHIMKALKGSPVPVPAMWGLEENENVIGTPFYLMERLRGTMPKDYPSYHGSGMLREMTPHERSALWWDSLSALTEIHRMDWNSLGLEFLGVPGGGFDPLDRQLDYWTRYLEWTRDDPSERHPVLERALEWLRENRYEPDRVSLCWGDARIGNMLYDERTRKIVGVLDWEMAFLGDAEADLAWFIFIDSYLAEEYRLPRLEGLPGPDETVRRYEEMTGRPVRHGRYNEIFAAMRFGMILISVVKKLMRLGMHNYGDMIVNNHCTRTLASVLGMPSPGEQPGAATSGDDGRLTVQFHLSGSGGGDWHIISEDGRAERREGIIDAPLCTVRSSFEDWRALQSGELNQLDAWTTGRLKVEGDLNVMIRLKDDISRLQG